VLNHILHNADVWVSGGIAAWILNLTPWSFYPLVKNAYCDYRGQCNNNSVHLLKCSTTARKPLTAYN